jgi:CrcB protein
VNFVLVALAGAVGAPLRYLADSWMQRHNPGIFPWGTLLINATGSLILGFVAGLALFHGLPESEQLLIGTGFCGAYTTFSTFAFESVRLAEDSARLKATANAVGSLVIGMLLAAAGIGLARLV